jgi:hypothetical protein
MSRTPPEPSALHGPALWEFLGERKGEPFVPFAAQVDVFNQIHIPWPGFRPDGTPYPTIYALNCGRRFSKTTIMEKLLWDGLTMEDDIFGPPVVRLTADTEEHAYKVWDRFILHAQNTLLEGLVANYSKERHLLTLKTGAEAQMLSANNPRSLSGDGVSLWLVDEAQELTLEAYENLYPSTAERDGIIIMAGVSEGEGPFKEISYRGDHPADNPEYLTIRKTTFDNPFVPRRRIELAKRTLSPEKFAQLYLAEWQEALSHLFREVERHVAPLPAYLADGGWGFLAPFRPNWLYYGGVDLARLSDWTVVTLFDHTGLLVAWDRFTNVDWALQKGRILALARAYGWPRFAVDSTGVGDPLCQELQAAGLAVEPVQISTNAVKRSLVDSLAIEIGAGRRHYPHLSTLLEELTRYEAHRSRTPGSNVIQYRAPAGVHDDWVMSLALANSLMPHALPARDYQEAEGLREVGAWEGM